MAAAIPIGQTPGVVPERAGFWSQIGGGATNILLGGLSRAVDAELAEHYQPKPDTQYQSVKPGQAAPAGVGVTAANTAGGEWYKNPLVIGGAVVLLGAVALLVARG